MTDYRLVYDSGSKLLKCALADDLGNILALESFKPEIIRSEDGFQREWNYRNYWDNLIQLTKKTIKSAKIEPVDIKYITSSSIRPSCVFTDNDNNAFYIGASFELRGIDYAEDIEGEFYEETGKTLFESCGHFPSLLFVPARYRYFQEMKGSDDRIAQITQYLPQDSWILVKFGGENHTNFVSAGESGLFDLETKFWHPAWENILDFPDYFLPWPVFSGEVIGIVSEEWQNELGLSSETKLVAGISDTQGALLGCQCVIPGEIGAVLGTTTPVQVITDKLILTSEQKTWSGLMSCKNLCDYYYLEANTGMTGQLLKWAANLFFSHKNSTLKQRFEKLDLAYQHYDKYEKEAALDHLEETRVYSLLGPAPLASTHMGMAPGLFKFESPGGVEEILINKESFIAAVFDNIQFAVTKNIEISMELAKIENPSISILGGITRNPTILQRFSDLLVKNIGTSTSYESTIQGLLVLCDIADGKIKSVDDLKKRNEKLRLLNTFTPREEMRKKLKTRYDEWLKLFNEYYR